MPLKHHWQVERLSTVYEGDISSLVLYASCSVCGALAAFKTSGDCGGPCGLGGSVEIEGALLPEHDTAAHGTYDRSVDALYVTIPGMEQVRVDHTKCFGETITIDYDALGKVVGVEVLGVSTLPPPSTPQEDRP